MFNPSGQFDWVITHAMLPVADYLEGDRYRIYFSGRNKHNQSSIGYIEVDINDPQNILYITEKPILTPSKPECFDGLGVSPACIVNYKGLKYLYYFGWNRNKTVSELAGLAISKDGGKTFDRVSKNPILEKTDMEPFPTLVISCVLIENGIWKMWYDSADVKISKDFPRKYNIKYAESSDGIKWDRKEITCINFNYNQKETTVSRGFVIKDNEIYKMWYCIAMIGGDYKKIGYAESNNGIDWIRKDKKLGLNLSESGWDSEMICYPFVFNHKGTKIMLYNGNKYGSTGFGYAILQ